MNSDAIIALVVGYLLGSIPWGFLLTRAAGKGDVREIGSGGTGATNVLRTGSKGLAAGTVLLDIGKGVLAVWLAQKFWPGGEVLAAAGALIGHLYPVWLKFRGGKGVATFFGTLIPLFPVAALVFAIVWIGLLLILRISSVSGMTASASAPVTAAVLGKVALFPPLLGFALLVIWNHRENIVRLAKGTEPRVGSKRA